MNTITRPVKLVVCDVDNTLTDTYLFWGVATGRALGALSKGLGLDWKTLAAAVLKAPGQYRFCDFRALTNWLEKNGHLGTAKNPEDDYERAIIKNYACQVWFDLQKRMARFYEGVPETLRRFKEDGAAIAFFTDTEASSLIRRFWLMAYNAAGKDFNGAMNIMKGVDHFYAMPSYECDQRILRDVPHEFVCAMRERMTIWKDKQYKPNVPHMEYVLRDFGILPHEAIMVGDSDKDAGCAFSGMPFAWARYGAELLDDVVRLAKQIASPTFKYGLTEVMKKIQEEKYKIDITLYNGFAELLDHFHGVPGAAFNPEARHSVRIEHLSSRSFDVAAGDIIPGVHVMELFRLLSRPGRPFLSTHLPPELPGQGSPDAVYTAGPERTGQQATVPVLAA